MTRASKPTAKRKPGRPSNGLSEVRIELRAPALLVAAVSELAGAQGVSVGEMWRRCARVRLGWDEVPGETQRRHDVLQRARTER